MDYLTQHEAIEIQKGLMVLAVNILMQKRKDYSGANDPFSNLRVAEFHGVHPVVGTNIRCNDKLSRVSRIVQAGTVEGGGMVGESVVDDLRDVINYVSISAGLLAEQNPAIKEALLTAAQNFEVTMQDFGVSDEPNL